MAASLQVNLSGKVIAVIGAFGALGAAVADDSAAVAAMTKIVQATGRLDGLVNIAGGFRFDVSGRT